MVVPNQRSWADVLSGKRQNATLIAHRPTEFSWKTGRATRRLQVGEKEGCNGKHCELSEGPCRQAQCNARHERLLNDAKAANESVQGMLEALLRELSKIKEEISQACNGEHLSSAEMEESRLALVRVNRKKIAALFCECIACQLEYQQQQSVLLKEKEVAAARRIKALKEYRLAYDVETLYRTSSAFVKCGKYFTPVGNTKAKGVTALRPTAQLQRSYDYTALMTNSMTQRPIKAGWKDKPKTVRIVNSSKPKGKGDLRKA